MSGFTRQRRSKALQFRGSGGRYARPTLQSAFGIDPDDGPCGSCGAHIFFVNQPDRVCPMCDKPARPATTEKPESPA